MTISVILLYYSSLRTVTDMCQTSYDWVTVLHRILLRGTKYELSFFSFFFFLLLFIVLFDDFAVDLM